MIETAILLGFTLILITGMILSMPLYVSLFFGFLLFYSYGKYKGFSFPELSEMSLKGIKTIGPILLLFMLIGMLTASWRAAGTISYITCLSSEIISPSTLVLLTFLLSALMGLITGSAFATSATIGVICMTIGNAMGANMALLGGAMLSGCFFGDRTSPVSGSSNLVATLTKTNLFYNLGRMIRVAIIPFLICCGIFWVAGLQVTHGTTIDFAERFADFHLSWIVITPTLVIIVLSLLKVNVKISMAASLALALMLCVFAQGMSVTEIPRLLVFGYHSQNPLIAPMVNGGGMLSMAHISLVIICASTYSGLFEGTGLLRGLRSSIVALSRKTTPYTGIFMTSLITSGVACDQTLSIMLTHQLCNKEVEGNNEALALDLLNSSSIVCAVMPWTTSCMGCLAFTGASPLSCLFAFFPIIMPLWYMGLSWYTRKNPTFVEGFIARQLGFRPEDELKHALGLIQTHMG